MRLDEKTPARVALKEYLTPIRRPVGRPALTWLKQIETDLNATNVQLNLPKDSPEQIIITLEKITKDRSNWKRIIKSAWKDYPQNMGRFRKGHVNSSGNHLLNLCFQNDLIITNTLFKHRLSHICTWEAPFRKFKMKDGTERRQPIRNQIDYIITNRKYQPFIINSRSYNNLKTETDHRLVKMTIKLNWYKIKFDTKNEPKYNLGDFNKPNTIKVYKNNIQKKCRLLRV